MSRLTLRQKDEWIKFKSTNSSFVNCVRSGIVPMSYRKYDSEDQCWYVWWERAPELVDIASRFYQVDWSELPGRWQMLIAGGKASSRPIPRRKPVSKVSPFAKLHLLDTAPRSVVKAAYKALLLAYHPDHNDGVGDKAKLNEVIDAYREVISTFDS